jgi:hypothetical protein
LYAVDFQDALETIIMRKVASTTAATASASAPASAPIAIPHVDSARVMGAAEEAVPKSVRRRIMRVGDDDDARMLSARDAPVSPRKQRPQLPSKPPADTGTTGAAAAAAGGGAPASPVQPVKPVSAAAAAVSVPTPFHLRFEITLDDLDVVAPAGVCVCV